MRQALLAVACAALLAAAPRAGLAQNAPAPQGEGKAAADAKTDQRPLFLSADVGLQFTPPPTFIRSVMSFRINNSRECVISR